MFISLLNANSASKLRPGFWLVAVLAFVMTFAQAYVWQVSTARHSEIVRLLAFSFAPLAAPYPYVRQMSNAICVLGLTFCLVGAARLPFFFVDMWQFAKTATTLASKRLRCRSGFNVFELCAECNSQTKLFSHIGSFAPPGARGAVWSSVRMASTPGPTSDGQHTHTRTHTHTHTHTPKKKALRGQPKLRTRPAIRALPV